MLNIASQADIALLRLPAPSLRGTFAKAYGLLTRLVSQIGWDDLLKTRSAVFVMEEEYRKHKTRSSIDSSALGTPRQQPPPPQSPLVADDNASTTGIASPKPSPSPVGVTLNGKTGDELDVPGTPIPTIRISSESDHEREHADLKKAGVGWSEVHPPSPVPEEEENGEGEEGTFKEVQIPDLEKPAATQTPKDAQSANEQHETNGTINREPKGKGKSTLTLEEDETEGEGNLTFSNKRLCERWLDTLFMTLYEVSRCGGGCRRRS